MIDTAGTVVSAAELLDEPRRGVGVDPGDPRPAVGPGGRPAEERPDPRGGGHQHACRSRREKHFDTLTVLSIAPIVAEALDAVFEDTSV